MNELKFEDLLNNMSKYEQEGIDKVIKAYQLAEELHANQYRQSGEPYIMHPLNVAYIQSEMHLDIDTICAGLLHDVLEDCNTKISKDELIEMFGKDVANLVDGVTKISGLNFSSKSEQNVANVRKLMNAFTSDARVLLIKLPDRLHNMRTLQYKSRQKQIENAAETMELYVPFAHCLGAYRIKSELEDLSLQYLYPESYKRISDIKKRIEKDSESCLKEMLETISGILNDNNIPFEIKVRTKNIYGIYKRINEGNKISDIHDLLSLKIMVDDIATCYQTLGIVHSQYNPVNDKFKDYIYCPKTNMYRSIHTTVFGPEDRLVQTQIRTFDMDKIASFGLAAYWDIEKGNAREVMQEQLKNKYQFYNSLVEINSVFADNQEFVHHVKNELFSDKVYVRTPKGSVIELPKGSTAIDFAYRISTNLGNTMTSAEINGKVVSPCYVLKNNDRVRVITDIMAYGPRKEWEDIVVTTRAKQKIKEWYEKK